MVETKIEQGFYYTDEHEWVSLAGDVFSIGITDYAQRALGDIVYLDLSVEKGVQLQKQENIGIVESVKAVGDLYAPLAGTVVGINPVLQEKAQLINQEPYGSWILRIKTDNKAQLEELMDSRAYGEYLKKLSLSDE